ncbi:Atypical protein kinase C [Hondaea fermentalgiana]|uniref:Atypical protein kinase C n=1 Tax=Hondaea fermentalgiana TaxID=2315210 RepID=A0A2R5GU25_9STRA|nr:Atypical protein kinase C [Hondaea fermentalgiana]|eukprot:GBG31891.1 Atypical protein kinase C [Hondaea fermentalgiana]
MVGDPVAQICCYMVSPECRYGILSNWKSTFFLKLEVDESSGSMGGKVQGVVDGVALAFDFSDVSLVVHVLFEQGVGYKRTTVTDLETGEEISDCFAKCIAVDEANARDAHSHQCAMHHFKNEVATYEGPALGLQGRVVPTVVHVGEFDMGAGKQAVLVTQNAGHALSPQEGMRITRAEGLVAVKKRVHAALRSLHEAGIIHGDMGLRNVTIREDGGVSLIDLGSAFCGGPSDAERDVELFDMDFDATFEAAELATSSREKNSSAKQGSAKQSSAEING